MGRVARRTFYPSAAADVAVAKIRAGVYRGFFRAVSPELDLLSFFRGYVYMYGLECMRVWNCFARFCYSTSCCTAELVHSDGVAVT